MTFALILALYIIALALVVYVTRRGYGLLGLALVSGALLATVWAPHLTPLVAQTGVVVVRPPLLSVVTIAVTLLPALLLIPKAPKVHKGVIHLVGSLMFGILAAALTFEAFLTGVTVDIHATEAVAVIRSHQAVIVTAGVVAAVLDIWLQRPHTHRRNEKHK